MPAEDGDLDVSNATATATASESNSNVTEAEDSECDGGRDPGSDPRISDVMCGF